MRVVAGEFKGRTLAGPPGKGVRPTSDKVREALFSILGPVQNLRVLDLFAGTGALGIEALSRGAASAVFVEKDGRAASTINKNLAATAGLAGERAKLVRGDALRALGDLAGEQFDLVFVDPPYAQAGVLAPRLAGLIPPVLAPNARVVAECDRRAPLELGGGASEAGLAMGLERKYGDTLIRIFSRSDAGEPVT